MKFLVFPVIHCYFDKFKKSWKNSICIKLPSQLILKKDLFELLCFIFKIEIFLIKSSFTTKTSKSISKVSFSTKKVIVQKGTGNARTGSTKSHLKIGGGSLFGNKPYLKSFKLNKKVWKKGFFYLLYVKKTNIFFFHISLNTITTLTYQTLKRKIIKNLEFSITKKILILLPVKLLKNKESLIFKDTFVTIKYLTNCFCYDLLINDYIVFLIT